LDYIVDSRGEVWAITNDGKVLGTLGFVGSFIAMGGRPTGETDLRQRMRQSGKGFYGEEEKKA